MTATATQYTQANRPLAVATPLGADVLLLEKFTGVEVLSQPFQFHLDLLAQSTTSIAFEKLLGQKVSIRLDLPDNKKRFFNGVVSRFTQGRDLPASQGDAAFTRYRMELVPQFALLRHRTNCRTFQQIAVPDILKTVLTGLDVAYQVQGTFPPRDYCVQYRETDFAFASRLMEEEGIFYFFKHTETGHQMIVANTPQAHTALEPSATVAFESLVQRTSRTEDRILGWEKSQQIQAGKTTLWDSCFELPGDSLQSLRPVPPDVSVGTVQHKLNAGGNSAMELYDYPGGYAQRFDGVDPSGGARAGDLSKIAPDGSRTAGIRMSQETLPAVVIAGESDCRHFTSGWQFTLKGHPNADGAYVLTRLEHTASLEGTYTTNNRPTLAYDNRFECIPLGLPFQPPRTTPKPCVAGTQPAIVVGPPGEEIFTDKYGRIKVQFDWDRLGKKNADSSCWMRVATPWAGKQWGTVHIPRVGMEVMVAFEEGDPDRPVVIGTVYNAAQMPPYTLPANKTQSGVKSRSSLKGGADDFNEICFEDKKGEELLYIRAEKDQKIAVENDEAHWVGHDRTKEVDHDEIVHIGNDRTENVDHDETITIKNNRTETVTEGDEKITIAKGNRTVEISMGNEKLTIKMGDQSTEISMGNQSTKISMGNQSTKLDLGASSTEAMQSIELKVGQSSVKVDQMGVTIKGMMISINGQIQTEVKGMMTTITGSAMLQESGGIIMIG
jgi:type VI secretion system secreted protein VgrG